MGIRWTSIKSQTRSMSTNLIMAKKNNRKGINK